MEVRIRTSKSQINFPTTTERYGRVLCTLAKKFKQVTFMQYKARNTTKVEKSVSNAYLFLKFCMASTAFFHSLADFSLANE